MWAQTGPLRFPGDPSCTFALLRDPGRTDKPGHSGFPSVAPDPTRRRLQHDHDFEASHLIWQGSVRRRSRPKQSSASTFCSPSSARSTALLLSCACVCARSVAAPWYVSWKCGSASSAPSSPGTTTRPRQSITVSRWGEFTRFLDDGRLCMSTDGVEKLSRQFMTTFFGFSFQAATIRS